MLIANIYNDGVEDFLFDADDIEPVFDINENLQGDDIITSRTFIIKKDSKYGVYNTLGEELIPIKYDEIVQFKPYEFAVRKADGYRMYTNGKLSAVVFKTLEELRQNIYVKQL